MLGDYKELLRPEIINSVKGLELISRIVTEGYLNGRNKSRSVNVGQEFSQYRSYEPGDDLRLLDWKMLARSGRYYIRQADLETNINVKFILDASNSMLHTEDGLSKIDYARILMASVGYLARHQGDGIELLTVNGSKQYHLHPKADRQHFKRFLHQLVETSPEGQWPGKLETAYQHTGREDRELVLFISDLYEHDEELIHFLGQLKTKRNEVVVIQLMGKNELGFEYATAISLQDLETGEKVKIGGKGMRDSYLTAIQERHHQLHHTMLDHSIDYHLYVLQAPPDEVLSHFLNRRKALV